MKLRAKIIKYIFYLTSNIRNFSKKKNTYKKKPNILVGLRLNRSIIGFIRADNIKIQGFHILCQSYFLSYFSAKAKIIFPLNSLTDLESMRKFI